MLTLVGVGWLFTSGNEREEVNVKGMSHFTLSAPSAGSAGFIFILRDSTMFWWRVSSQESHFQRENMGTLAQRKTYVLTAIIFLVCFFFFYCGLKSSETLRKTGSLL